jgi:uncharacterized membrane protein
MNTQTVVDQMTSMLAQRRQQTRDRRTAYLALARAILAEPGELYGTDQRPTPLGERHGFAA